MYEELFLDMPFRRRLLRKLTLCEQILILSLELLLEPSEEDSSHVSDMFTSHVDKLLLLGINSLLRNHL